MTRSQTADTRTQTAKRPQTSKRKVVSLEKKKAHAGWLFVLPFVIGFIIIYLPIVVDSIMYSFNTIKMSTQGQYLEFVGLEHYREALVSDADFVQTLITGLTQLVLDIPAIVIFSLFMAVLLNKKMFGRAAFRAIFFIPVILSTGIIANIDSNNLLNSYMSSGSIDDGSGASATDDLVSKADLSRLFEGMQIGDGLLEIVTTLVQKIYDIINRSGVQMLIFLAGLQSISPAIYESCSIDGATGWETFWKITFPMISPMILVNAIYTVIDSFTDESSAVMKYIDQTYLTAGGGAKELSTAMSWIYFLIVLLVILLVAAILSAYVFYQKRD